MANPLVLVVALPLAVAVLNLVLPAAARKLFVLASLVAALVLVDNIYWHR